MLRVCIHLREIPKQKYLYLLSRDAIWAEIVVLDILSKILQLHCSNVFQIPVVLEQPQLYLEEQPYPCLLITKEVGVSLQSFEKCSHNNYCVFFNIQHTLLTRDWKFAQSAQ